MDYQQMSELPEYEHITAMPIPPASEGKVRWTGPAAPPAIGTAVVATINNCGPATVTGYFTQDGFLGLLVKLSDPPAWHSRQNKGDPTGHLFGPEFRLAGVDPIADRRGDLARKRRDLLDQRGQTNGHGRRARIQQQIDAIDAQLEALRAA